ncbi:dethiobiotin synthase [Fusobacterium sp. MFO224]|uniref:dethiobiotin synthase n=1 Tax=Fusobacterium sp. MFO224 TaxID=3378070 RepID=UPI003853688E
MEKELKSGYFITGVGTDVGKTYVSALLYKGLREKNNVGYYKPIQSGCFYKADRIIAPDVKFVCDFSGVSYDEEMCTCTLMPEVSPHLAAEMENREINMNEVYENLDIKKKKYSTLLVEGAGGAYVPVIRNKLYMFDIMKKLKFPIILVSNTKVGGINHTMLTIEFLRLKGIEIQGIVFNGYTNEKYEDDNIKVVLEDSGIKNYIIVNKNQKSLDQKDLTKLFRGEKNGNK